MDNEYESYLKEHAEADSTRFQSLASKEVLSLRQPACRGAGQGIETKQRNSRLKGALEIAGKEGEKLLQAHRRPGWGVAPGSRAAAHWKKGAYYL